MPEGRWLPDAPRPRLYRLDARRRREHHFIGPADCCRYLLVYHPGRPRDPVSRLMRAFKCPPSLAISYCALAQRKARALAWIAAQLRASMPRHWMDQCTWVPIPTSTARGEPDYDDRLERTLRQVFATPAADVRLLLRQQRSTLPDHRAERRMALPVLQDLIGIDTAALATAVPRDRIMLFDDLLTSGKHYRCCVQRLQEALPGIPIGGCFIARRALRLPANCPAGYGK